MQGLWDGLSSYLKTGHGQFERIEEKVKQSLMHILNVKLS